MLVERKTKNELRLSELYVGECFFYKDNVFMKSAPKNGEAIPTVSLSTGYLNFDISATELVTPANFKAIELD